MVIKKLFETYSDTIRDNDVIIPYALFMSEISDDIRFVIDEPSDLSMLADKLGLILNQDKDAAIYACAYRLPLSTGGFFVYCDTLWVVTALSADNLHKLFIDSKEIEPSDIGLVLSSGENGHLCVSISESGTIEFADTLGCDDELLSAKYMYWD